MHLGVCIAGGLTLGCGMRFCDLSLLSARSGFRHGGSFGTASDFYTIVS